MLDPPTARDPQNKKWPTTLKIDRTAKTNRRNDCPFRRHFIFSIQLSLRLRYDVRTRITPVAVTRAAADGARPHVIDRAGCQAGQDDAARGGERTRRFPTRTLQCQTLTREC